MTRWNSYSNVADVLSLGPRTAGMLMQVGVRTAGELLRAKPQALASRLQDERYTAETIACWQREASLLLELPGLDADAARVLAALGFSHPATIARMTPTELLTEWETKLQTEPANSWLAQRSRPSVRDVNSWIQQAQMAALERAA